MTYHTPSNLLSSPALFSGADVPPEPHPENTRALISVDLSQTHRVERKQELLNSKHKVDLYVRKANVSPQFIPS